ncbi:MAG: M23 family metallopeptidase [Clostridia bacterium]|nr:M23 family metallopeptidase [Clostridia bacterium]
MNDNQENKDLFEDEPKREPLTKRIAKFSAFIYLGLAITVVIAATVGIFSISYDYDASLPPVSFPEIDLTPPDISLPVEESEREETSDSPVGNEQSGVTPDVSVPDPPRTMYYFPVEGEVIKNYSMDALVYSDTMKDYRVHSGIDIASPVGSEVIAFTDGVVSAVSDDYFNGMTVVITHEQGVVSYYMNLDPTLAEGIEVGAEVLAGQPVGYVGTTARIEALEPAHLHFEMRVNGSHIDPLPELP